MHIKKLEITGFKSFVDRTVIHFDHDVVAIVGPNGCGKSNIVDAVRWCLGEQSAKHLRGRAMEDVIFNGSESRAHSGMAEVTITFDNTNPEYAASLPTEYRDYPEIAVTRRLYRDGTSEYLVNKTQVRLRDITELFLGTGVGTKAYSVVEQGRIGQIVSARPEDRRLFLEEAAGITKYKQRRKLAERKMELTRQNLVRLNDIVSEIDRTRASLKRQVAKAERFIEYRRELDDLVLHDASHRLLELIVLARVQEEAQEGASQQSLRVRGELASSELELEQARERALAVEIAAEEASRAAFLADNETSSLQAEIARAQDRLAHLTERLDLAQTELDVSVARHAGLSEEEAILTRRVEELTQEERTREADALSEIEALSHLQAEESVANEEVMGLRRQVGERRTQAAGIEARLDGFAHRLSDGRTRRDRLMTERDRLIGELGDAIARKQVLEHSLEQLSEGKRITSQEKTELEQRLAALKSRQPESERAMDSARNELGTKRSRLRALEDLHRRLEGVGTGARLLLTQNDPRVVGLVADRIEAPEKFTRAVAGLLGDRLQCVVVQDPEAGIQLLEQLKQAKRGRAEVIPLHPRFVAGRLGTGLATAEVGVLGRLVDFLQFAPEAESLIHALVGDALLVESPEDALRVARLIPSVSVVALDGTVVHPNGVVSGGAGDGVAAAMLEQKREMHQLTAEVQRLEAHAARVSAEHQALRVELSEVTTALDRARQEAHQGELAHITAAKDLSRANSEIERAELRQGTIDGDVEELDRALEGALLAEAEARAQLDSLRSDLNRFEQEQARAEATVTSWREQVGHQASLVTERKVRLAQVREQAESSRQAVHKVSASLRELEVRREKLNQEIVEGTASLGETTAQLILAREAQGGAAQAAKLAHQVFDEAKYQLEEVRQVLGSREAALKALRDELTVHDDTLRKHELELQRLRLEHSHLVAAVRERFRGLELARVVGDYHARPAPDTEHRRRIDELTQLIDRMGPVNLDAKTEHDDAEKRFTALNDQKIDIEKALEELDNAIKHMNRESRKRFKETFDSVNLLFSKTFAKLFRGGRAELLLTTPDDLLGSGVEIVAQPPGKKLGNIDLMSGGEKALTAVSLIFAIFQHRPSPFCVLDEVDAPLDEANVTRYNEMIRSMTSSSQFILITHIKKTMQCTDVLYGVTMGEPGVSRIVSVKVNENAVVRSDAHAGANPAGRAPELEAAAQVA